MPSLALYAESVYRHAPQLRGKNLLSEIEQDFESGVPAEDSAEFLTAITQNSTIRGVPLPQIKPIDSHTPEALASHVLQMYGKTKAIDLVLKETWRHERGSTMFKFYAGVLRRLVGGGV